MKTKLLSIFAVLFVLLFISMSSINAQSLPNGIIMKDIDGGTFTMGRNSLNGSPDQKSTAPEHQVKLSSYSLSEAEVTNAQYVAFFNTAYNEFVITIGEGIRGLAKGKAIVFGIERRYNVYK